MHLLADLATAIALLTLFGFAEILRRGGVAPETTRRLVHLAGAGVAAFFPLYLALGDVVLLGIVFTALLVWTWLRGSLRSIHAVHRPTAGALLFPSGLILTALLTWSRPAAYAFGALVLALADPAAGLLGQRLGGKSWPVAGGRKHLSGSLAAFSVALCLGITFSLAAGHVSLPAVIATAVIITLVEGVLGYGLDNLPLPMVAGLLGVYWLNL